MGHIRKLIYVVLPLFILTSCCLNRAEDSEWYGHGEWVQKVDSNEIVHAVQHFMPYLRHEKHLRLEDARVFYGEGINTVRMEFLSQDILEIREARFLIVDLVEGLIAEFNQNPILGPQISQFPLSADQLEIYIEFESFNCLYNDPYYVGNIMLQDGTTHFYGFNTKYPGEDIWDYRIEPYFKSREIVINEREGEKVFKETMEKASPRILNEQYVSPEKTIPRYFTEYDQNYIFEDN